MRDLSLHQTLIAAFALAGITALGLAGKVSSDALVAVYSAIAGGALGYVNGKKTAATHNDDQG